jgi:hypothetical protein
LVLFGFASTLPAAEAALEPVWRLLRAKALPSFPPQRLRRTEAGAETGAATRQAVHRRRRRRGAGQPVP